jgi:hypothetical protein
MSKELKVVSAMPFLRHSLRRGISQLGHSSADISETG